ncbi:hypothetical protein TNCV_1696761 [Trichonephila clavipes]|nr:hypothetical protein TNCV_1696761 [Trichonephila clavipes]
MPASPLPSPLGNRGHPARIEAATLDLISEHGTLAERPGRSANRNIRSEDIMETLQQSHAEDPSVSMRHRSSQ